VTNGIISFITTDATSKDSVYSLFKVKGVDGLQKVSDTLDKDADQMTIEDLLILAATTNDIDYPSSIGIDASGPTMFQEVLSVGAPILLVCTAIACPLTVAPAVLATIVAKDAVSIANHYNTERPKPRL